MRILVLSDSHGRVGPMEEAVEAVRPQQIFHLGDGWDDARELHRRYPDIPLHQVRGNCDYRPGEPEEETLLIGGLRILLCHGHRFGVKQSLLQAGYTAEERDLDCFLFGHTHQPFHDRRGKCTFLNPGSVNFGGSFAVLAAQKNASGSSRAACRSASVEMSTPRISGGRPCAASAS